MKDHTIWHSITCAVVATFADGYEFLAPYLAFALVLIIADCRFGILCARKRGDKVQFKFACKRSMHKAIDYLCWCLIAYCLQVSFVQSFDLPILPTLALLFAYSIELSSIINNYLYYKGISKKISFVKIIAKIFKKPEIEDCFEDAKPQQNN